MWTQYELTKLGGGPSNPTEAQMEKRSEDEEAESAVRRKKAPEPPLPPHNTKLGEAANRFLASMNITYEMWHDGEGYDLDEALPGSAACPCCRNSAGVDV
jgi:hypothetical protein